MADLYISESGSGLKDGTSLDNAMDIASTITADFLVPTVGVEYVFFVGTFTTMAKVKASGISDTEKILIDCSTYSAVFASTTDLYAFFFNARKYIEVDGGTYTGGTSVTVNFDDGTGNVLKNPVITSPTGVIGAGFIVSDVDNVGSYLENPTITVDKDVLGVRFSLSTNVLDTGKFIGCGVTGGVVNEKIFFQTLDVENQIDVNSRRPDSCFITDVEQPATARSAVQFGYSSTNSVISGGSYIGCGTAGAGLNNCIQTNWNLGLIIENNYINNYRNPSSTGGDSNGIILDWTDYLGNYSEDAICRRNIINDVAEPLSISASAISMWGVKNAEVYCNLVTNSTNGIGASNALSGHTSTITATSVANPTILTVVMGNNREIQTGDLINIQNITGGSYSAAINAQHIATKIDSTHFSIPIECTVEGTLTTAQVYDAQRPSSNLIYNNTIVGSTRDGIVHKYGDLGTTDINNILVDNDKGINNNAFQGAQLGTESYNCFFNNASGNVVDDGVTQAIDSTSFDSDPLFVDAANGDYRLQQTSPCVGVGTKWWGLDPRPDSLGEPLPDRDIDLGAYQSTWSPNHPKNI